MVERGGYTPPPKVVVVSKERKVQGRNKVTNVWGGGTTVSFSSDPNTVYTSGGKTESGQNTIIKTTTLPQQTITPTTEQAKTIRPNETVSRSSLIGKRVSGQGVTDTPLTVTRVNNKILYTYDYRKEGKGIKQYTYTFNSTPSDPSKFNLKNFLFTTPQQVKQYKQQQLGIKPKANIGDKIENVWRAKVAEPYGKWINTKVTNPTARKILGYETNYRVTDTGKYLFFSPAFQTTTGMAKDITGQIKAMNAQDNINTRFYTEIVRNDKGYTSTSTVASKVNGKSYISNVKQANANLNSKSAISAGKANTFFTDKKSLVRVDSNVGGITVNTGKASLKTTLQQGGAKVTGQANIGNSLVTRTVSQNVKSTAYKNFGTYPVSSNIKNTLNKWDIVTYGRQAGVIYPTGSNTLAYEGIYGAKSISGLSPKSINIGGTIKIIDKATPSFTSVGGTITQQKTQFSSNALQKAVTQALATGTAQTSLTKTASASVVSSKGLVYAGIPRYTTATKQNTKLGFSSVSFNPAPKVKTVPTIPVPKTTTATRTTPKTVVGFSGGSMLGSLQNQKVTPIQIVTPKQTTTTVTKGFFGRPISPSLNNTNFNFAKTNTTEPPIPFLLPLRMGGLSGIGNVKGGKFKTRYVPSFTALVYNIRGKKPKTALKTGINFRPIPVNYDIIKKRKLRGFKIKL